MNLQERLSEDLKSAMKAKDSMTVNTLRMVRAQMQNFQIAKGEELTEEDEIAVLSNAAKKRREALELYEKSGRPDLVDKETAELDIISAYLPEKLSNDEIAKVVRTVIEDVGATSIQDLGQVMGAAMKNLKGKADGKTVQEIVRQTLS